MRHARNLPNIQLGLKGRNMLGPQGRAHLADVLNGRPRSPDSDVLMPFPDSPPALALRPPSGRPCHQANLPPDRQTTPAPGGLARAIHSLEIWLGTSTKQLQLERGCAGGAATRKFVGARPALAPAQRRTPIQRHPPMNAHHPRPD